MMKRYWVLLLILFAVAGISEMADAKLIVIGTATYTGAGANDSRGILGRQDNEPGEAQARGDYNLVYEDDRGLVWLDFSNGSAIWPNQMKWVAGLNNQGVLTYKLNPGVSVSWEGDWRLPKAVDGARYWGYDGKTNTAGYNVTTDDMGHLFYVSLGNQGAYDTKGTRQGNAGGMPGGPGGGGGSVKNTGPFKNLRATNYWTGTQFLDYEGVWCWSFSTSSGQLNTMGLQQEGFMAMAVRPAKVSGAN